MFADREDLWPRPGPGSRALVAAPWPWPWPNARRRQAASPGMRTCSQRGPTPTVRRSCGPAGWRLASEPRRSLHQRAFPAPAPSAREVTEDRKVKEAGTVFRQSRVVKLIYSEGLFITWFSQCSLESSTRRDACSAHRSSQATGAYPPAPPPRHERRLLAEPCY